MDYSKFKLKLDADTNAHPIDLDSPIRKKIRKITGKDVNADPEIAHSVIVDLVDEIIYSSGLRKAICEEVYGQPAGEEMRLQLLYDILLITEPTDEELKEVKDALVNDRAKFKEDNPDEDEDDEEED